MSVPLQFALSRLAFVAQLQWARQGPNARAIGAQATEGEGVVGAMQVGWAGVESIATQVDAHRLPTGVLRRSDRSHLR